MGGASYNATTPCYLFTVQHAPAYCFIANLCNTSNSTAVHVSHQEALDPQLVGSLVAASSHPVVSPALTKYIQLGLYGW